MINQLQRVFTKIPYWVRIAIQLVACTVLGGLISLVLGRDASMLPMDRALYSAHALLTGRMNMDLFAAGEGPVLNPLLYIPYYLIFVKLNNFPHLSVFLAGFPYGLLVFLVWKVCTRLFKENGNLVVVMFAALAVTGSAALANIGVGNGSIGLAVFAVWAFILLLDIKNPYKRKWSFFIAAFAAGLHFSAFPALVGIAAASFVLHSGSARKRNYLEDIAFALAGFLLALSVGMWYAWQTGVLDSFWGFFWPKGWAFGLSPWAERWELPANLQEWVFLPFWRIRYALSGYVLDVRIACGIICSVILLAKYFFSPPAEYSCTETALSWFFLGTYICWLLGWRTADSSIVLEFLGVLLLGRCLVWLIGGRGAVLCALVLLWLFFPLRTPEKRQGIENHNFSFFKEPVFEKNSLVLLSGHVSGLIPFLPQDARYVGGIWFDPQDYSVASQFYLHRLNPLPSGYYSHRWDEAVRETVREHAGAIYAVVPQEKATDRPAVWQRYGVKFNETLDTCQLLNPADVTGEKGFLLCSVQKIPDGK